MLLGSSGGRARSAATSQSSTTSRLECTVGIEVSRPSRTNDPQHARDVLGLVVVLVASGARARPRPGPRARRPRRGGAACRRRRGRRARRRRAAAPPCAAARSSSPVSARTASSVGRAEHQRGEHARAGRRRRGGRPAPGRRRATSVTATSVAHGPSIGRARSRHGRARSDRRRAGPGRDGPSRRRRLRLRRVGGGDDRRRHRGRRTASSPTATRAAPRPACPARRWRRCAATSRRAAAAVVGVHDLHFLGYPDGRVEPTLELRRDITRVIRTGAPRPGDDAVARPQLGPHLREPSRPPRDRRGDDRARCTPTRATAGRIPSSRPKGSSRGRVPAAVDGRGRDRRRRTTSTSPTRSTARSRRCCVTRASCPIRTRPATMVRGWTGAIAASGRAARRTLRRGDASGRHTR